MLFRSTFHPIAGRFAAGYVSGAADAVDTIASVRLMVGNVLLACRTLVHGDRDGVSCDIDPEQDDCPRPEYTVPAVRAYGKLLRLGLLPIIVERPGPGISSAGTVVLKVLLLDRRVHRLALGDASCAEGGGTQLGATVRVGATGGPGGAGGNAGLYGYPVGAITVSPIRSARVTSSGGPAACVDLVLHQRVAPR